MDPGGETGEEEGAGAGWREGGGGEGGEDGGGEEKSESNDLTSTNSHLTGLTSFAFFKSL